MLSGWIAVAEYFAAGLRGFAYKTRIPLEGMRKEFVGGWREDHVCQVRMSDRFLDVAFRSIRMEFPPCNRIGRLGAWQYAAALEV